MKIALAADLHFGSVPEGLASALREAMEAQEPDVIVIAGDLTLRARKREFEQASAWLLSLKPPALVIPGNHDLPYVNLIQRFRNPFKRYRRAANAATLMPVVECEDGLVLGFNTARSWQPHFRWQEGAARLRDIERASAVLDAAPAGLFKAVAVHHPLMTIPGFPRAHPVRRGDLALASFAKAGVSLVMSGHIHQSFAIEVSVAGRPMAAVGAPTALSSRMRGEANGFWMIDATVRSMDCALWLRDGSGFRPAAETSLLCRRLEG